MDRHPAARQLTATTALTHTSTKPESGAAVVRALALSLAGESDETEVQFPAVTITQQFLLDEGVTNVAALREVEPGLQLGDFLTADWLPAVSQ